MSEENGKQNGKGRRDDRVRVALVGVGNCANSLLQGVEYYKDAPDDQFVPGLMHVNLGGYHVSDIDFTAAFDVTTDKVGKDLADAILAQLNVGGNSDFLNMLEADRLESKKISKTNAVTSMLDYDLGAQNVHVGPSDYVPWLTDRKWAYIRMEGSSFGDVPLNLELKLEVWDSPNSAGIVI